MKSEDDRAIQEQWEYILSNGDLRLRAIAFEAARYPNLRRLFPFASLSNLHFSRTTSYPYDDLPYVLVTPSDEHEARGADRRPLGKGDLPSVVRLVSEAIGEDGKPEKDTPTLK